MSGDSSNRTFYDNESGRHDNFSVNIETEKVTSKLKYEWGVSAGTIVEGQRASIIKVVTTPEMAGANVTAKIEIQGLPANCPNQFSEVSAIDNPPPDCGFDNYGKISWNEEMARLDSLFVSVMNVPNGTAFIRIFAPEKRQARKHIEKIVKHANFRKLSKQRLIFSIEEATEQKAVISIFLENKKNPDCENCEIIKGEDVK